MRYDQFARECPGCAWLKTGEYPDGMPYLACRWHGTIMHEDSGESCSDFRTEGQVKLYFNEVKRRKK